MIKFSWRLYLCSSAFFDCATLSKQLLERPFAPTLMFFFQNLALQILVELTADGI